MVTTISVCQSRLQNPDLHETLSRAFRSSGQTSFTPAALTAPVISPSEIDKLSCSSHSSKEDVSVGFRRSFKYFFYCPSTVLSQSQLYSTTLYTVQVEHRFPLLSHLMIFQNLFEENEQLRISQFYSLFNAIPGSTSVGVWVRWHQCGCQGIYLGSSVIFLLFCCPDGYILLIYESQTLLGLLPVKPQTFYLRNKPEIFLHYWLNTYHSCFSLRSAQKDREQRAASWYTSEPT